jgi:hypothetical protein
MGGHLVEGVCEGALDEENPALRQSQVAVSHLRPTIRRDREGGGYERGEMVAAGGWVKYREGPMEKRTAGK